MMDAEKLFWDAYEQLAEDGKCDGPGGAEYDRVLAEWLSLGKPTPIKTFIVTRASAGPDGKGREILN